MFERFTKTSALESAQKTAASLMSERGEANARGVAGKLVNQFKLLDKTEQLKFFEFLAKQFSPDPGAVLDAAPCLTQSMESDLGHCYGVPQQSFTCGQKNIKTDPN